MVWRHIEPEELKYPTSQSTLPIFEARGNRIWEPSSCSQEFCSEVLGKIATKGAVLLRGLKVDSASEFRDFLDRLGFDPSTSYVMGPETRRPYAKGVYNSTDRDNACIIHFHNEMSYKLQRPRYMAFYAQRPASIGGETPICDFIKVLDTLPSPLVDKLKEMLTRHYRRVSKAELGQLGHDNVFRGGTALWCQGKTIQQIENDLTSEGFLFNWKDEGIETYIDLPTVIKHPGNGKLVLQTNLEYFHPSVLPSTYRLHWRRALRSPLSKFSFLVGLSFLWTPLARILLRTYQQGSRKIFVCNDGQPGLTTSEAEMISRVAWDCSTMFRWAKNDILIVDNFWFGHGRMNVTNAKERLTLASMCNTTAILGTD